MEDGGWGRVCVCLEPEEQTEEQEARGGVDSSVKPLDSIARVFRIPDLNLFGTRRNKRQKTFYQLFSLKEVRGHRRGHTEPRQGYGRGGNHRNQTVRNKVMQDVTSRKINRHHSCFAIMECSAG